jgi:hypothetical protein
MTKVMQVDGRWDYSAEDFIPGTREVWIGRGIVYRPIRSWHCNVLAGEGITAVSSGAETWDRSGCLEMVNGRRMCGVPYAVVHRVYWNMKDPERRHSAFLSYPGAMGAVDAYFWELMGPGGEVERFAQEAELEQRVLELWGDVAL